MAQVSLDEAQQRLADLIAAAKRGEEVVIAENGEPAVRLVRVETAQPRRRRAGSAKGKIVMAEDFDAPLEDFKEYME